MARRIEIELTSARPDGSWTWRAAGALKPRGVLDGSLLYEGAKAGDVVRADADFELEGIVVVAVLAPREKKRNEPERLEVVGPPRPEAPGVTSSLTSRPEQRRDRPDGGPRPPRRGGEAGAGRGGEGRERRGPGQPGGGDRPARDRPARERPPRPAGEQQAGRDGPARESTPREGAPREGTPRPPRARPPERSTPDRGPRAPAAETAARPKARRLNPGNVHRSAVLESLPPEERPIAEQVLRGGIPAVRTALHLEREKASAEGRQPPNSEALLAIAEGLLPRLKAAEWQDRAEAAAKIADDLSIRDLRSVVAGADVARDDDSRQLAVQLRDALERRLNAQRQEWLDDVSANLADGRVVRALRVSARPPDPGCRFPAELATRLAEVAGGAMAPDTPAERWAALLEAVAASPVRRSVKPVGLPPDPGEALLHAARQSSGRIPALAVMLGISMPPPPGPVRPSARPSRPGSRPVPPPPAPAGGGESAHSQARSQETAVPAPPGVPAGTTPAPPVKPEVEPVEAAAPVEPEVEPMEAAAPVDPEVEPVEAAAPVEPEVEPVEAAAPVDPEVEPVEAAAPVDPDAQPVEAAAPVEPDAQPVEAAAPVEPDSQPVEAAAPEERGAGGEQSDPGAPPGEHSVATGSSSAS